MKKAVEEMSEEAFQKHIQALALRRLDKPKKLSAECAKHWGEIISQQYNFDRGETSQRFSSNTSLVLGFRCRLHLLN